jgi:putative spermidine/putrescine transport system ATP-binding protein
MVFQNYALFPHMTVRQNLAFPLEVRHLDKAEMAGRITRALEMVELAGYADRMPVQLSGGQQQRIALARALIFEPDIVLMDEPLGALDKQLRDQMQFEIKHLHERLGLTVVYVTHDQSEALTMSDRIAVFHNGEIQQLSTPAELYEHPCNSFVAHFIGENNRLPGVVEALEPGGLCRVRLRSGDLVPALRVNVKTAGDRTLLSIRPERVTLAAAGDTDCVVLEGRVLELIFLGDHVRVRLAVAGSDDFIIKIPNAQNRRQLAPGEILRLGCRPEDLHALDGGT